eukprot:TRINITY_DN140_c0_g1_i3.p1 TRINITY_DN140_c0_g1~~TRINITY_DN140_c0_g1_i3.p1  ORF type:complete len:230 (+),score=39.29 TRINITY_DN140_c0_g1_i3:53-742(+)
MHVMHNCAAMMGLHSSMTTEDPAFVVGCVSDSDDACSSMQGTLPHSRSGTPTIDSPHAHQLRHCWERSMCELCQGQSRCRSAPMWCDACQCSMCDDCASSCGCRSELHSGGDWSDVGPETPSSGPQTTVEAPPVSGELFQGFAAMCWDASQCSTCQGYGCRCDLHHGGDSSNVGSEQMTEEALPVLSKIMDHKPHPAFSIRPVKAKKKGRGRGGARQNRVGAGRQPNGY